MKKKTTSLKYTLFTMILAVTILVPASIFAQTFVLDLQYNPMEFKEANRTLIQNNGSNGNAEGSIHKYDNVTTYDGVTVYAHLTIKEINNAFIVIFDDDNITGDQHRFQPRIGSNNGGGYIVYELEFFDAADDQPIFLENYYMTGFDIDGNGNNREYVEVGGYSSYQKDQTCQLTITSNNQTGRTKFFGINYSLPGVTFENKASFIANFENPNNKISFALGQSSKNSVRYYSVQFGAQPDEFDNPVVINNPLPIAVDDQGTPVINTQGGISVQDITDNDLFDGEPINIDDINITIIDPGTEAGIQVNTTTGQVTVAPGTPAGTYELVYKICMKDNPEDCDIATITVPVEAQQIITNKYPATGFGTLAYEDLWPGKGDYDFNDLVIDFQFEVTTNQNNKISHVDATFIIQAFGATKENGFGFQFEGNIDQNDLNVSGYELSENYITLNNNGTEAGQSKPTIILFDNAFNQMPHPGGIGVNTEQDQPYVTPDTLRLHIEFAANKYTMDDLNISGFNPFLIIDQDRSMEVHLPNYTPTDLANTSVLGTDADASSIASGKYYVTENNLPWAIKIYESFDYPVEKIEILDAHLKFEQWAVSGGEDFPDWYKDLNGYRNDENIYEKP